MVIIFSCKNNVITQNKLPYFIAYEAHFFNESLKFWGESYLLGFTGRCSSSLLSVSNDFYIF